MNTILKQTVSIVTPKPQTTEIQIRGIFTEPPYQIVFIDTPGIHKKIYSSKNRSMNQHAHRAIYDAQLVLLMLEADHWTREDERIINLLIQEKVPCIVAFNKSDKLKSLKSLLPRVQWLNDNLSPLSILPISTLNGENIADLIDLLKEHLPEKPFPYPVDMTIKTTQTQEQQVYESIRKQMLIHLNKEIPYQAKYEVTQIKRVKTKFFVHATIKIQTIGHKKIIIGHKGEMIKTIGQNARLELAELWKKPVDLRLHIQVGKS